MPSTAREWALFAVGICVLAALIALIIAQQTRSSTLHPRRATASTFARTQSTTAPTDSSSQTTTEQPAPHVTSADRPVLAQPARLVLTAVRGDSWLILRSSSATGKILYQGTLVRGRSLRITGNRFWARFGSAAHLDVSLDGKAVALGTGTFDTVIEP